MALLDGAVSEVGGRADVGSPRLSRTLYPLRTLGMVLQVAGASSFWWYFGAPRTLWIVTAVAVVWPHVAYARVRGGDHNSELRNLPIDSIICGVTPPILAFNPLPTITMISTLVVSVCATGGRPALARNAAALLLGMAGSTLIHGLHFQPETPILTVAACAPALVLFPSVVALTSYRLTREVASIRKRLGAEKALSEALLLNVLPPPIAQRLKANPTHIAERYAAVSILFADIVGFTVLAQRLDPEATVRMLNELFTAFDDLAERHGLEKIKTIGDAYMAVAGLPERRCDHAPAAAAMALDMLMVVERIGGGDLQLRIGLNARPVVAGVIGKKKFSYDLWGDAVNTASRMESHGEPGRIHVSAAMRELLGDAHTFEARGRISVKGKGEMETYFLRSSESA